jgi:acetoin utilization protein AcuC
MAQEFVVLIDESLQQYDFGPQHPLGPIRVLLTYDEIRKHGILNSPAVETSAITRSFDELLLTKVHTQTYVDAIKLASVTPDFFDIDHGIGSTDVPRFDGMHAASTQVCAATFTVTQAVAEGNAIHGVNIAGGLHHAMPNKASGFCVYNDIAVSIQWLLDQGYERIAYIDVDAHHGDGVEQVFWDDPRVMTISIHESGHTLFPGTGFSHDAGGPHALGFAVNIALPRHVDDASWLRAFDAVVPELLEEFKPQVIFSQHGCDSHRADPLTNMELSVDGQALSYRWIHEWAHTYAGGNWIAVGGGGYALYEVVPRIWTHLVAIATHQDELVAFTDNETISFKKFHSGWDPHNEIDRAIMATRNSVFPHHGMIADPFSRF